MKELSIKEKAKRYDKAIELVNSKWHYKNQPCIIDVSEIFPELKESEDKRIRKWLVKYFQDFKSTGIEGFANGLKIDSIIDWLEKQVDNKDIHLLELKSKRYDEAKERMSYAYNQNRVPIGFVNEIFPNLNLYKNQSNNTNKVEPKFKVGDWVAINSELRFASPLYIKDIDKSNYRVESLDGNSGAPTIDYLDNHYHLWTIKDAKDGDVLVSESQCGLGTWYCIFKSLDDDESMTVYCYLARDGRFETKKELCFDRDPFNTKPATKEQRDTLFAKMKEAGYKWDAGKKELIKL